MAPVSIPSSLSSTASFLSRSALTSDSLPHISSRVVLESTSHSLRSLSNLQPLSGHFSNIASRQTTASSSNGQSVVAIPATYSGLNAGPQPGTVVGIVLGTVGGILLILYLLYTCFNMGGTSGATAVAASEIDVEVVRRDRERRRRSVAPASAPSEVIEVSRRSRTPPPRRQERIIIEETSRPRERERSRIVEEREDDIVEVIEEHSPPPQRRSRRVSSGYRNVDPGEFAGGDRPMRKVRR